MSKAKYLKWIGVLAAVLLVVSCFTPWVFIESQKITVSGVDTTGTSFGKPGYLHFIMAFFFLLFSFIPMLWAKRANLAVVGINMAWAIRNFLLIAVCRGGECPSRKTGLWLMMLASVLMLAAALFPDVNLKENKADK
jgi:hypothetical protein